MSTRKRRKNTPEKFTVKDREELKQLIKAMIDRDGPNCDLNFIDVSQVTDMSELFIDAQNFNGDISQWDVSNVTNMDGMFDRCYLTPPAWYSNRANPSNNNVSEQENTDDSIGDYIELNDIVL